MPAGGRRQGAGRPPLPVGESERALRRRKLRAQAEREELLLAKEKRQLIDAKRAESRRFVLERCLRDMIQNWTIPAAAELVGLLGDQGVGLDVRNVSLALDTMVNGLLHRIAATIYSDPSYLVRPGDFELPYPGENGNGHAPE